MMRAGRLGRSDILLGRGWCSGGLGTRVVGGLGLTGWTKDGRRGRSRVSSSVRCQPTFLLPQTYSPSSAALLDLEDTSLLCSACSLPPPLPPSCLPPAEEWWAPSSRGEATVLERGRGKGWAPAVILDMAFVEKLKVGVGDLHREEEEKRRQGREKRKGKEGRWVLGGEKQKGTS